MRPLLTGLGIYALLRTSLLYFTAIYGTSLRSHRPLSPEEQTFAFGQHHKRSCTSAQGQRSTSQESTHTQSWGGRCLHWRNMLNNFWRLGGSKGSSGVLCLAGLVSGLNSCQDIQKGHICNWAAEAIISRGLSMGIAEQRREGFSHVFGHFQCVSKKNAECG